MFIDLEHSNGHPNRVNVHHVKQIYPWSDMSGNSIGTEIDFGGGEVERYKNKFEDVIAWTDPFCGNNEKLS